MSPEAQRIEITKAVGIEILGIEDGVPYMARKYDLKRGGLQPANQPVPDYLNDLNAMRTVERRLKLDQRGPYWDWLARITEKDRMATVAWLTTTASASQRAEAFLKTIGKWTED